MDLKQGKEEIHRDFVLSKLMRLSKEKGIPLFLVGGYLRDLLLGTRSKDYDFTLPKEVSSFVPAIEEALGFRFFKVGKDEMNTATYRVIKEDISVDLAFWQGETIEEDLGKRDFTVNAIAFSLRDETFHWMERSLEDIGKKLIRPVSGHSIDQDPLRMLRAIRYLCTLDGFDMDKELKKEISLKKEQIRKAAAERIKTELDQVLLSSRPRVGMNDLHESGLLFTLMPEFKGLERLGQGNHHHLNVLPHILLMIEKISWASEWTAGRGTPVSLGREDWLALYYAALFHDIGKQDTFSEDEEGKVHFYYHESYSCQRAEGIMDRLRFSNQLKNRILNLVQHHMRILNLSGQTKEGALKRLVNQMGEETSLLVLHTLADKEASRGILSIQIDDVVEKHCLRILELFKEKDILHPLPFVTGHDVMALGYSPGPRVGQILHFIRQKQVEGEIKIREEALRILKDKFGAKEQR
ncbi:MAG: CCA tRNA nucleotidyltransferase [Thermodesulfobacteriota bacterium]